MAPMSSVETRTVVPAHPDRLFIGGEWVEPSSDAMIDVIDPTSEKLFFRVVQTDAADMSRAIGAARDAFDHGPWPRLSHLERAEYLRALAAGLRVRAEDVAQISPRQSGILYADALQAPRRAAVGLESYAALAETFPFEEQVEPSRGGGYGLLVREPVGVVGAIVAWNGPLGGFTHKAGPALLAGCPVVLKLSPEAPGEGYIVAEIAEEIGLPPGVLNVVTADREVSEVLVRDPRVDKIAITGSTVAGRRVAALCAERIARCTLELGGKSAAVILDDADVGAAAETIARSECRLTGQVCSSLTRVVVNRDRHDEMLDAIASVFSQIRIGDPFDLETEMGPLTTSRHRDRVEGYIAKGIAQGATLAAGGGRPSHLERGWFIEPTVFGNVDSSHTIAQEEIFGPVLCVIPADDEQHAITIANDTIYGLNASVFTNDAGRARDVARQLRTGTVGHNAWRTDFGLSFGGFKQSGIGREGAREGVQAFVEVKTIILEDAPPEDAR
jgi:acyl-CoA reductase-like NAD-dependent aldehyde dehydrogenase